jgi:hypothetical protein
MSAQPQPFMIPDVKEGEKAAERAKTVLVLYKLTVGMLSMMGSAPRQKKKNLDYVTTLPRIYRSLFLY